MYANEIAQRAVMDALFTSFGMALAEVEAMWQGAGSDVELPAPVTWFSGHNPTVLELPSTAFPFVSVIDAGRNPTSPKAAWGYQEQVISLFVDWFVVAEDAATVNLICQRYAQALCQVLARSRVLSSELPDLAFSQEDYELAVTLSEASRHGKFTGDDLGADMFNPADVDFIKGGRITVNLRV